MTAFERQDWDAVERFFEDEVAPCADRWDREQATPEETIAALADRGLLRGGLPEDWGGAPNPDASFARLCQVAGGASMSLLSLLTVHGMVCRALAVWGKPEQKQRWLPDLAAGRRVGAFGLTEPDIGSDASRVQSVLTPANGGYELSGEKHWISYAQRADVFLVFAQLKDKPAAALVPADAPGVAVVPIADMLGFRASMMGRVTFKNAPVAEEALIGRPGFGVSHVALSALDLGRFAIANGCVGLGRRCLDASVEHASARHQFGGPLADKQLIQKMLADMDCRLTAAALMCERAAALRAAGDPDSIIETAKAKYVASHAANDLADAAVQIHGAAGCGPDLPIQRCYRDARIAKIIEGSDQMQQIMIAKSLRPKRRSARA